LTLEFVLGLEDSIISKGEDKYINSNNGVNCWPGVVTKYGEK